MHKLMQLFSISGLVLISITTVPIAHADYDWQTQLAQNPNQYWEMDDNRYLIQKQNSNHEITYQIQSPKHNQYYKAWQYAINQYNSLGVIKLIPTNQTPEITLSGTYDKAASKKFLQNPNAKPQIGNNVNGITYYNYQPTNNPTYNYLINTRCIISNDFSYLGNTTVFKTLAEHELGHALGFDHNDNLVNNKNLIMATQIDFYGKHPVKINPLGAYEQKALLDHYRN